MNAYVVTFLVSIAGATFVSPAFGDDRSPDEMRREVEAEFERLRAADDGRAPQPQPQPAAANERAAGAARTAAIQLCAEHIRAQAPHPDLVDISFFLGTHAATVPGGAMSVSVKFNEKNVFGVTTSWVGHCAVSADGRLQRYWRKPG